jgi:hypothetical protein
MFAVVWMGKGRGPEGSYEVHRVAFVLREDEVEREA